MDSKTLATAIFYCGIGHIVLSVASLVIPKALNWNQHLKNLPPLLRQMFWTYAGYILVINFCFGVISIIAPDELVSKSILAKAITFFIAVYWLARIGIQFFYFDRTTAPKGLIFTLGEVALVVLFVLFTIVFFAAFLYNSWM